MSLKKRITALGITLAMTIFMVVPASASTFSGDGNGTVPVSYTGTVTPIVTPTYDVTVTALLNLDWTGTGNDYSGAYRLGVRGNIGNTNSIKVSPPASTFAMTGADTGTVISANISQVKDTWAGTELTISDPPVESDYSMTTGTVTATFNTYEAYEGGVSFVYALTERE